MYLKIHSFDFLLLGTELFTYIFFCFYATKCLCSFKLVPLLVTPLGYLLISELLNGRIFRF